MSLNFTDGSTDEIDCGTDSSLDTTGTGAYITWIRPTALVANHFIAGRRVDANNALLLTLSDTLGNFSFRIKRATTDALAVSSGAPITVNEWNYLAFLWDLVTEAPTMMHGTLDTLPTEVSYGSQIQGSGNAQPGNTAPFSIGGTSGVTSITFAGDIAFGALWDDILLQVKAQQVWRRPHSTGPSQVLWMPLGLIDGTGNQFDYSGFGNTGVTTGVTKGQSIPLDLWAHYKPQYPLRRSSVVQTVSPAPVTATFVVPAPILITGAVTVSPPPVTASFNVPTPTLVAGLLTVSPSPVTASFAVPTPTLVNILTVNPPSVVATFNVPLPTLIGGTVTVQPTPVIGTFNIPVPTLTLGSITAFPSPAIATFIVPVPTLIIGGTVAPPPVVANFIVPLPVKIGDRFIIGIGATGAWVGEDTHIATVVSLGPTVWSFVIQRVGESLYRRATNESLTWDGTDWQALTGYGEKTVITPTYTANKQHFIQADDDIVGGIVTISLPLLTTVKGGYVVAKIGSTSDVDIVGLGGNTIDFVAKKTLSTQNDSFTFVKGSNTNWKIV